MVFGLINMVYSQKVIEHFTHPKNLGKIKYPDGTGAAGNPVCGDIMTMYIKIGRKKRKARLTSRLPASPKLQRGEDSARLAAKRGKTEEILTDIKFETLGCAAAIATSSMITEMAKGKTISEALKITRNDVANELEGLPPIKMHCSNLAAEALHRAIEDYLRKKTKTQNSNL